MRRSSTTPFVVARSSPRSSHEQSALISTVLLEREAPMNFTTLALSASPVACPAVIEPLNAGEA